MLAQASLSLSFWSDAFATATYLINYLSTKALRGIAPVWKLFGKPPDLLSLKVFGCRCYPLLRTYNRHKLQHRSTPCVFLGYVENSKGFKCRDQNGEIYVSRHVRFDELVFLFKKSEVADTESDKSKSSS